MPETQSKGNGKNAGTGVTKAKSDTTIVYDGDIDMMIESLQDLRSTSAECADGQEIDQECRDDIADFIRHDAYMLTVLLRELKKRRAVARQKGEGDGGDIGTHRILLEGFHSESMQEAFGNALDKAYHYFSDLHHVNVSVVGMASLPKGGYRVTIELQIVSGSKGRQHKRAEADVEMKRLQKQGDKNFRQKYEEQMGHFMHDHFLSTSSAPYIPDYLMVGVQDAELMNVMAAHEFFKASRAVKGADIDPAIEHAFIVRTLRPDED